MPWLRSCISLSQDRQALAQEVFIGGWASLQRMARRAAAVAFSIVLSLVLSLQFLSAFPFVRSLSVASQKLAAKQAATAGLLRCLSVQPASEVTVLNVSDHRELIQQKAQATPFPALPYGPGLDSTAFTPEQRNGCASVLLTELLGQACGKHAATAIADDLHDSARLQAFLMTRQHPANCATRRVFVFKDWRNGLGAQLSSLLGSWTALLSDGEPADGAAVLTASGGMRYANKRLCPQRDLSCYFEPLSSCPPVSLSKARAVKTPPAVAVDLSHLLGLRRERDTWWLRKELIKYIFRLNRNTSNMLNRVTEEMQLGKGANTQLSDLVGLHVRRGDKKDLGAKDRGEPFPDAMYVIATKAVAAEINAKGVLLASSEPQTLRTLPQQLLPLTTYVMPAKYFVHVPNGHTPHKVVEATQSISSQDEGRSQIVQLLLLARTAAFVGTITSNFGGLVTKLMGMRTVSPLALDLSCEGLRWMRNVSAVWNVFGSPSAKHAKEFFPAACRRAHTVTV